MQKMSEFQKREHQKMMQNFENILDQQRDFNDKEFLHLLGYDDQEQSMLPDLDSLNASRLEKLGRRKTYKLLNHND